MEDDLQRSPPMGLAPSSSLTAGAHHAWTPGATEPAAEMTIDRLESRTAMIRLRGFDAPPEPHHRIAPVISVQRGAA